jgi:hypothetical protein
MIKPSEVTMRDQAERIRSFHQELDRLAAKYSIGHMLTIMEINVPGKEDPIIATLSNYELGDLSGKHAIQSSFCRICDMYKPECEASGLHEFKPYDEATRAEELLLMAWLAIVKHGYPRIETGKDFAVKNGIAEEVDDLTEYFNANA